MRRFWLWSKALGGMGLLALLGVGAFGAYQDGPLDGAIRTPVLPASLPAARAPAGLRFALLLTGHSAGAPEGLLVAGGSWWKNRQLVQTAVLIEHPKGTLLFDTGLGREVGQQFALNSALDRRLLAFDGLDPAVEQLARQGLPASHVDSIIPSHMHWDHVSGLVDFPQAQVWVLPAERREAEQGAAPAFLHSQFAHGVAWRDLAFTGPAYLGFSHSQDVFADGSVVLVPLHGHTAGQVGLFLTLPSGKRYFFTGDVSWTLEGLQTGADRSWLLRQLLTVDHEVAANQAVIMQIHRLLQAFPALTVVPAHDENVAQGLPHFPNFEG